MNKYPTIKAYEYESYCGNTDLGGGILMTVDGEEFCRLTNGTIVEKEVALLWQASTKLLY